jgi:ATP-dependent helicase HrpA
VPAHLRMTFSVEADDGRVLGRDKDLAALRARLQPRTRARLSKAARAVERTGLRDWPGGTVARAFTDSSGGQEVVGFPALVDAGDSVELRVLETEGAQRREMRRGIRRLLLLRLSSPLSWVRGQLDNRTKLALAHNPHGGVPQLLDDCLTCAVDALMDRNGGPVWDEAGFVTLFEKVRADLHDTVLDVVRHVARVLSLAHDLRLRLEQTTAPVLQPAVDDMNAQLDGLVHPGFVTEVGADRLPDLVRYLRAVEHRLDRLPAAVARDQQETERVQALEDAYLDRLEALREGAETPEALIQVRWMIEELRVSAFAQQLGTRYPVSEKRVRRALAQA